jgi:hypothetical protein
MRKLNMLVLDEFITKTGSEFVYTRTDLNETLGQVDKLALQLVADQASTGTPSVTAQLQHSADGINWINKGSALVTLGTTVNATTTAAGADAGTTPSLGLVRLAFQLSAAGQVHVKAWVTGRDDG